MEDSVKNKNRRNCFVSYSVLCLQRSTVKYCNFINIQEKFSSYFITKTKPENISYLMKTSAVSLFSILLRPECNERALDWERLTLS
jgi:hypothetical protein